MPPEQIAGRYRVEREIGRGGMGSVWLCRDEVLGRQVAIKQVGLLPGESATDLARAMREARSGAALQHPNVVSVFDAVSEGEQTWLVMEHVPGRTLSEIVAQDGPLPPARAAAIGAQVADGLAAAHRLGTVHRDVKPGNVLVTDDGVAKISDFGIARTTGDPTLTDSGLVTGTPAYFSPELARGEDPSPASDVWALGATLFTAVEGRAAYPTDRNGLATLQTIASERPPAPTRAGPLADAIGRMMDADPRSRWSMDDAAHALHRVAERYDADRTLGETIARTAPVAAAAADEPADAAPAGQAAAARTPAEPARDRVDPATSATPATPAALSPARDRRRRTALLAVLAAVLVVVVAAAAGIWWGSGDDAGSGSAGPSASGAKHTGSGKHSPDPSSPDPSTTEPSATDPSTTGSSPDGGSTAGAAESPSAFVRDYYAVLPDDTRTGWSQLSEEYQAQEGGYGQYAGFWRTIDAVSVDDAREAGGGTVDVSLTYTTDGSTQSEVRRIYLQRSGDGWVISDDEVVG